MKILFLVPDGVGVRNYLYSNIIANLIAENVDVVIGSSLPKDAFIELESINDFELQYQKCDIYKENFISRILRESTTFARLLHNFNKVKNKTILTNWNYKPKSFKQTILLKTAQFIGKWASKKYSRILFFEEKGKACWNEKSVQEATDILAELKLNKIFITHQRVAGLMPYCIAAKRLGIEVISVIYSWDNLPKARLAIEADKYLVWSDYMKDEMQLYYPEIAPKKIIVTGTPQFEFYLQKERVLEREVFAEQYSLDVSKKWICFSGDDVKTSPYDPQYLEDLAGVVSQIREDKRPQILFRRCPVDFSGRYDAVIAKYSSVIKAIDPLWNTPQSGKNWGSVFPQYEDVNLQVNIAFHCELVINLGSTMAHDFAMFNKPCLYLNYDTVIDKDWSVKTIYNYQHFKSMNNLDAVGWLNSKEEIKNELEKALSQPELVGKDKEKWLEQIILLPVNQASKNIASQLK